MSNKTGPEELGYNGKIGLRVYDMTRAGVSVKDIFASIQSSFGSSAPKSLTTFYKYYRQDMDRARAEVVESIGNEVVKQALAGDYKSQELYLRSKGGWSPNETVNHNEEQDEMEEAESAIEALSRLLGKE